MKRTLFVAVALALVLAFPAFGLWPDSGGDPVTGADIDPANILFSEDTGDGINNITAFSADDLRLTTSGASGDIDLISGTDILLQPGGASGEDITADLGVAGNFIFNAASTTNGLNFTFVGFDVLKVRQGSGLSPIFNSNSSNLSTGFTLNRDTAGNAGIAHTLFQDVGSTELARVNEVGNFINVPGTTTIADSGDANPATATISCRRRTHQITCNDANGCDVTLGETNVKNGQLCVFVNVSANTVNFADTSGVSEIASAFAAGQYDSLSVFYSVDRWIESSRSDN